MLTRPKIGGWALTQEWSVLLYNRSRYLESMQVLSAQQPPTHTIVRCSREEPPEVCTAASVHMYMYIQVHCCQCTHVHAL